VSLRYSRGSHPGLRDVAPFGARNGDVSIVCPGACATRLYGVAPFRGSGWHCPVCGLEMSELFFLLATRKAVVQIILVGRVFVGGCPISIFPRSASFNR
jgi:hypothetical protein